MTRQVINTLADINRNRFLPMKGVERTEKRMERKRSKQEAKYDEIGDRPFIVCSNCVFWIPPDEQCHIVEESRSPFEGEIQPNGVCMFFSYKGTGPAFLRLRFL